MGTLGEAFRAAREDHGISLSSAEGATKIRREYLAALETDHYGDLPAPVYVRAYVRTYASYLGLDSDASVAQYDQTGSKREVFGVQREAKPVRAPSAVTGATLLFLVVLAVVTSLGYYLYNQYSSFTLGGLPSASAAATPSAFPEVSPAPDLSSRPIAEALSTPEPTATPVITPSPTPIPGVHLEVKVKDRSWLRVLVDDQLVYEGIPQVGASFKWDGREKIVMRTGNAAGVDATFNGKSEGALGAPGEVKDIQWTAAR